MRSLPKALILCSIAFLGACAGKSTEQPLMSETDPAVMALRDAAMRTARSNEQAALSSTAARKVNRVTEEYKVDLKRLPPEMREPLLLENGFNGELEMFVTSLMDVIGWPKPIVLGARPTTPKIISMTEQRRPPAEWLADAGFQAGKVADIRINPSLRQVVIKYMEVGSSK